MSDSLTEYTAGDVTVVQFKQQKIRDEVHIQQVGEELYAVANRLPNEKLLLNLENVAMMSSAMLGKLVSLKKRLEKSGAQLKLCSLQNDLRQVFAITGLTTFFDIQANLNAAVTTFNSQ